MTGSPQPGERNRRAAAWLSLVIFLGFGLRLTSLVWGQAYCHFAQGDGIEAYSTVVDYGLGSPRARYLGQPNFNERSKLPGPLWTVFGFICRRVWGSAEGIAIGILLLNTTVIYLTYLLAKRTIGLARALWTAFLAATLPWVVYYSVGIYNPEVMSFLSALLFLALWRVTRIDRSKSIFWVPLLWFAMPQFHMSGLTLLPAVLLILWLSPARLNVYWLLGGIAAGLALYYPYLHGDMLQGWQNSRGMLGGGGGASHWDSLKALATPLCYLVNWAPEWTHDKAGYHDLGRACFGSFRLFLALNLLSAVVAAFLVVGAFLEVRSALRGFWAAPRKAFARAPGILFLTVLLLAPLVASLASGKPFHTRYGIVLLPVMLPLTAVAVLHWLASPRFGRIFRVGFALTCCANLWLMAAMYYSQGKAIEKGPTFIPSFRKLETVYQSLKAHADTNSRVAVDPAAYLQDAAVPEVVRHQVILLFSYVRVRERENGLEGGGHPLAPYRICREDQVKPDDPGLAYRGNGIALVAVPK